MKLSHKFQTSLISSYECLELVGSLKAYSQSPELRSQGPVFSCRLVLCETVETVYPLFEVKIEVPYRVLGLT